MAHYGPMCRKSLRCKDFYNHTVARLGRLWSTDCGSHGRGPRFDPLCVHHQARDVWVFTYRKAWMRRR